MSCDFAFEKEAPINRIAPDESEGERAVRQQAEADKLHPLFRSILRPFCAGIAERMMKGNEKEKHYE